jgi:hypothetical protein
MSISIQNLSGYPQPFVHAPNDLKYLLEVDEGLWSVCIGHTDNLSLPQKLIEHLDQDLDNLILAKDIKNSIQWCLARIQEPKWFFDLDFDFDFDLETEKERQLPISYLPEHLQSAARHFINVPSSKSLLLSELRDNRAALQKNYSDGLLFLRDINKTFHSDFLILCRVLKKTDGLSEGEIQQAFDTIEAYTEWETKKKPTTFLPCTSKVLQHWDSIEKDILLFFDSHFRNHQETNNETLFAHTEHPYIENKKQWVIPQKQDVWNDFCASILDIYHLHHDYPIYLDIDVWRELSVEMENIRNYLASKPVIDWSSILLEERNLLQKNTAFQNSLDALFIKEEQIRNELRLADELHLLFLYQKYLLSIISVFANFVDFYNPTQTSLIETGVVLIDGQYLHLVLHVQDVAQHKKRAIHSELFLIYVEVLSNNNKMICSITQGRKKDWYVGKKGVYIDRNNVQHPIQICDMIENPISIAEELTIPFFTFIEFIKSRFDVWSSGRKIELEKQMDSLMVSTQKNTSKNPTQSEIPGSSWLMHGGLAFAALGSSFAYILQTLTSIPLVTLLTLLIAPLILWMLISGIRGGIKIHNRDLSPLLEGNGWSLHHALHIPIWANEIFTKNPKLPKDHKKIPQDKLIDFYTKIDPFFAIKYRFLIVLLITLLFLFYKNREDIIAILDLM